MAGEGTHPMTKALTTAAEDPREEIATLVRTLHEA